MKSKSVIVRYVAIVAIGIGFFPKLNASTAASSAAYFGLTPPAEKPELFAPGIVNLPNRSVGHLAFSADGTECAFTVFESFYANNRILLTHYENGAWTPAAPLPGPAGHDILEPLFSRDGQQLYFTAKTVGGTPAVDFRVSRRNAQGWSDSERLPSPLNQGRRNFCLSQTADGTFYFASDREGGRGGLDLYRAISKSGADYQVENLGASINSPFDDGDPAVSPDGHMLVFYSATNRSRGAGSSDLFICFDNGKGGWTNPVNLGDGFNTPAEEYGATFSQDCEVLFFTRFDGKKGEAYWISTKTLERYRKLSETAVSPPAEELPPERKAIALPVDVLQRYVGSYVMDSPPGLINQITWETDQLMTRIVGQPKVPLFPESETQFFLKVADVQFEFVTNSQGAVTDLIIHQNGMNIKLARKDDAKSIVSRP